jgi:hypothetical protein
VSNEILEQLDFPDIDIYINFIKGKQTNTRRFKANRTSGVLNVKHTNICGPFPTVSWNGQQYFITFINDFLVNMAAFISFMKRKSLSTCSKYFKFEVENPLN